MGKNYSRLSAKIDQRPRSSLFSLSVEQLKNFYEAFKATCENFCIDFKEFEAIFGESREIFDLWDKNETCLIDALEVFSGLALLCETKLEEKIKLLFEMFDFNDLNSLSRTDVEFIIHCCLSSIRRISKYEEEFEPDEIEALVKSHFHQDSRINLSQMIGFCKQSSEINDFFQTIGRDFYDIGLAKQRSGGFPQTIPSFLTEDSRLAKAESLKQPLELIHGGHILESPGNLQRNKLIEALADSLELGQSKEAVVKNSALRLNWVYGFRCNDSIKSFVHHSKNFCARRKSDLDEKIIYCVSTVVVLYYYKLNKQRHYTEHRSPVGSIAVSRDKELCATGEKGHRGLVHVWSIETLKTKLTIHTENPADIHLLEFVGSDKYLVTASVRSDTPIFMYELLTGEKIMSTRFAGFVLDVLSITPLLDNLPREGKAFYYGAGDLETSFMCLSQKRISMFVLDDKTNVIKETVLLDVQSVVPAKCRINEITSGCALYMDPGQPQASAYSPADKVQLVFYFTADTGCLYAITKDRESKAWRVKLQADLRSKVVQMILFRNQYLCLADANAVIHLFDISSSLVVQEFDMTQWNVSFESMNFKNMVAGKNKSVFIGTWDGGIVKISLRQKQVWCQSLLLDQTKGRKIGCLTYLPGELRALCCLKYSDEETLIYFGGDHCVVYCFSIVARTMIEKWHLKAPLTAIAGYVNSEGCINVAVGLDNGAVVLFINQKESWTYRSHEGAPIYSLAFSRNGKYMYAASNTGSFIIFESRKRVFVDPTPMINYLSDGEIPLAANFYDDSETILIQTHSSKFYKFVIKKLSQNVLADPGEIGRAIVKLQCPSSENPLVHRKSLPVLMDRRLGIIYAATAQGCLSVFNAEDAIKANYESTIFGHHGTVSDLEMCLEKRLIFSVGKYDNAVFEWKIDLEVISSTENTKTLSYTDDVHFDGVSEEKRANANVEKRADHSLNDSLGYFRSYSKEDLLQILDIKSTEHHPPKSAAYKYPQCSLQLYHVYSLQTFDVHNNFCYIHCPLKDTKNFGERHETKSQLNCTKEKFKDFSGNTSFKLPSNKESGQRDGYHALYNVSSKCPSMLTSKVNSPTKAFNESKRVIDAPTIGAFAPRVDSQRESTTRPVLKERALEEEAGDLMNVYRYYSRCESHGPDCSRRIVYFISRIAIVVSPDNLNVQKFYEGHKEKISVMAVHRRFTLIATGERAYRPKIHVWDPLSCQTTMVCQTFHRGGIMALRFSFDKYFIVSASCDEASSIQVTDWRAGSVRAFRNAFTKKIISVEFDPLDESYFATASLNEVNCWRVLNTTIAHLRRVVIPLCNNPAYITDMIFITQYVREKMERCLLVSTSTGSIGVVAQNEYFDVALKKKDPITCMKIVVFESIPIVVVGDNHETLTFYTLAFKDAVHTITLNHEKRSKAQPQVQSLDLFINGSLLYCLVGLRTGILVEVLIQLAYDPARRRLLFNDLYNKSLIKGHVPLKLSRTVAQGQQTLVDKQLLFTLHPTLNLMVSVGSDHMLYFWNTEQRTPVNVVELHKQPTSVKFTPNAKFLVVGFIDGSLKFYSTAMIKNIEIINLTLEKDSKGDEFTIQHQEISHAVLNMEFSNNSNLLAVSYLNSNLKFEKENATSHYSGGIINVYASKETSKNDSRSAQGNAYNFHILLQPSATDQTNIGQSSDIGISCYFMCFSSDCNYLVAYYQSIYNNLHTRDINDTSGKYVIYSLSNKSVYNLANIIRPLQISTLYFPNHLNGKFSSFLATGSGEGADAGETDLATGGASKNIVVSCIASTNSISALGSKSGEIFLVKSDMVTVDSRELDFGHYNRILLSHYQAKRYSAHSSFVNQIQFNSHSEGDSGKKAHTDFLFTTGIDDECIFQWKLVPVAKSEYKQNWDKEMSKVPYYISEVQSEESLNAFLSQICVRRNSIPAVREQRNTQDIKGPSISMKAVLGRKALTGRSNMLLLLTGQLLYPSGTTLVLLNKNLGGSVEGQSVQPKPSGPPPSQLPSNSHNPNTANNTFKELSRFSNQAQPKSSQYGNAPQPTRANLPVNPKAPSGRRLTICINDKVGFWQSFQGGAPTSSAQMSFLLQPAKDFKAPAEIACVELAPDSVTLCAATQDKHAQIFFWEIYSHTPKGDFILKDCVQLLILRCSHDSQYLVCCGVTAEYAVSFYYCSIRELRILAVLNLKFDNPKRIADISFLPHANDTFKTVGFAHCWEWRYRAGVLSFHEITLRSSTVTNLSADYSAPDDTGDAEIKQQSIVDWFLVVKYLTTKIYVLAGEFGKVYLCLDDVVYDQISIFDDCPITAVAHSPERQDWFVVGGYSADVAFVKLCTNVENKIHLVQTKRVTIESLIGDPHSPQCQVQTLVFPSMETLICGSRDGSIHEIAGAFDDQMNLDSCPCAAAEKMKSQEVLNFHNEALKAPLYKSHEVLHGFDHCYPKAADFSWDSSLLFVVSQRGYFTCYVVETLAATFQYDFSASVVNMCVAATCVLLILEDKILAISIERLVGDSKSSPRQLVHLIDEVYKPYRQDPKPKDSIADNPFARDKGTDVHESSNEQDLLVGSSNENIEQPKLKSRRQSPEKAPSHSLRSSALDSDANERDYLRKESRGLDQRIIDARMSGSGEYLAVAVRSAQRQEPPCHTLKMLRVHSAEKEPPAIRVIPLQSLEHNQTAEEILALLFELETPSYKYADFSLDENYLLVTSKTGRGTVYNILKNKAKSLGKDFVGAIEWQSMGLTTAEKYCFLDDAGSSRNKLTSVVRLENGLLTADELGTVS